LGWGKEGGIQYHPLEDSYYNNLRNTQLSKFFPSGMWHACLRQSPVVTHHVSNGKVQLYETLLGWGGMRWL